MFQNARGSTIIYIAATFIGTIVGAGFASGQEVYKFFGAHGFQGLLGIFIASILFAFFGYILLSLGFTKKFFSYHELFQFLFNKRIAVVFDLILTLFLLGLSSVMAAGAGTVFYQYAQIPKSLGTGITLILAYIVVKSGLEGITRINVVVVPLLIIFVVSVASMTVKSYEIGDFKTPAAIPTGWLFSSVLYVSYNIALALGVILPLGKKVKSKSDIVIGALLGSGVLGLLLFAIDFSLLSMPEGFLKSEIPLLRTVNNYLLFKLAFSLVLWAEIFTTLIGTSFAFLSRLLKLSSNKYNGLFYWIFIFFLSQLGFAKLVGILYPFFGLICLTILIQLSLITIKGLY